MDQNVNYYGIILLLRQLRESGSFSAKRSCGGWRHGSPRTAARTL